MATKEENKKTALVVLPIFGLGALVYFLFRRQAAAANGNGNGVEGLTIERFFVVNTGSANNGEFDAHIHIRNNGAAPATGQIHLTGQIFINKGQLVQPIDELESFTLQPGEVVDVGLYGADAVRDDAAWVQASGDWGEQTPVMEFIVGYGSSEVELVATDVGSDYAILRYAQRSECDSWDFSCRTPPPPLPREHRVSYPRLSLADSWTSIYHLMPGLWPNSTYYARCTGRGVAVREGRTEFTTT